MRTELRYLESLHAPPATMTVWCYTDATLVTAPVLLKLNADNLLRLVPRVGISATKSGRFTPFRPDYDPFVTTPGNPSALHERSKDLDNRTFDLHYFPDMTGHFCSACRLEIVYACVGGLLCPLRRRETLVSPSL